MKVIDYLNRVEQINKDMQKLMNERNELDKMARETQLLNVELGAFKEELLKSCSKVKVEMDFHFFSGIKTQEDFKNYIKLNGPLIFKLKISTISKNGDNAACSIGNYYDENTLLSDGSKLIDNLIVRNNNPFVGFISLPEEKLDKLMINIDPIWHVEVYRKNLFKEGFINAIRKREKQESEKLAKSYSQRRSPKPHQIPPHVRYNPDELNESEM